MNERHKSLIMILITIKYEARPGEMRAAVGSSERGWYGGIGKTAEAN